MKGTTVIPEHFTLHEVAGGIWSTETDFNGIAVGNAAIIDAGAGKTIVVDTFMSDVAAQELRSVAEALTGNKVFLAVNSHWHGDHTSGNQVFGDVPIVSTRLTMEQLLATAPGDIDAWQAEIDQTIAHLATTADDDPIAAKRLASHRTFRDFASRFKLTLPDLLIEDRIVIEGERAVEIATLGRGHTVSDVFVWVPDAAAVVTGDLCWNGVHPRMNDGFPLDWATYVESLMALEPKHVIPGHGAPTTAAGLTDLPDYFRTVATLVDDVRAGTPATELPPPGTSSEWADLQRFHASLEVLAQR
jgi:glyoxylase-like metal-dependent hydrolase (beta-lactamase superfamily II)